MRTRPNRPRLPNIDPRVARLIGRPMTRRGFLGLSGAAVVAAACGNDSDAVTDAADDANGLAGTLKFSNWPFYIDVTEDESESPTLVQFEEEFGIDVDYIEEINSNDEWFGRFRTQLAAGESIDRDIAVLTDWLAARLIRLGWVEPINKANVPNGANLLASLQDAIVDPGREFTLPWQSGLTGIGYNPALVGREITSINDLFDDDLAGQVTFLTEMRDTMALVMASMDIDPDDHTFEEYERAVERVREAADSGQVRQFTGNEYVADLAAGSIAAAMAWSGDVIQLQFDNPELQFVIPDEGAVLWSDEMLIPQKPPNQPAAEAMMNFVYQPEIAAQIAAWVNFITPVEGAREAMEEIDPELVDNPLIFPDAEMLSGTFEFKVLDEEEEMAYQDLFQGVLGA